LHFDEELDQVSRVTKEAMMKWITRERPKIDRIACPWLILRFIDRDAEFLYVPASEVLAIAEKTVRHPMTSRE